MIMFIVGANGAFGWQDRIYKFVIILVNGGSPWLDINDEWIKLKYNKHRGEPMKFSFR